MVTRDKDRTRATLLAAGERVASEYGLAGLSVGRVIDAAGASKGSFFHHFTDRSAFLVALHQDFHARMGEVVGTATAGMPPGRERVVRAADAYWDFALAERGMRALLFEARVDPAVRENARRETAAQVKTFGPDLRTMRVSGSASVGRLLVAMVVEVAFAETESGHRETQLRNAFFALLPGSSDGSREGPLPPANDGKP